MSLLNSPALTAPVDPETQGATPEVLSPERALLSPTWIAALAVLGLNDHFFKGAGILPELLTGKLSDVAGMLVAPALLAAVTRTKSRRGLFLCHLAVGAVFAAINLSGDAAAAWSALMGLAGSPWLITVDPTDVLVLPTLFLSWKVLSPTMNKPVPRSRVRAVEGSLAALGVCLSVATSQGEPWDEGWSSNPVMADVYVQNISTQSTVVRIRQLSEGVEYSCFDLEADPSVLSEEVFDEAVAYTLNEGNLVAVRDVSLQSQDCYAVLIEGDTFPQTFVFWKLGEISEQWIDGVEAQKGGLILEWDEDDARHTITPMEYPEMVYPLADLENPPAGACTPQEDGARLAWTRLTANTNNRIAALDVGPDGCIAVDLAADQPDSITDWYVCVPPELFPFEVDDWIRSEELNDTLVVRRVTGPGQEPITEMAELYISSGDSLPPLVDTTLSLSSDFDCALAPDACGTVSRNASLTAQRGGLPVKTIAVGETAHLDVDGSNLAIHLAHAQERVVVNTSCSEGPAGTGSDIEVVAVYTGS